MQKWAGRKNWSAWLSECFGNFCFQSDILKLVEKWKEKSDNIKYRFNMNTKMNKLFSKYKGHWVSVSEDYSKVFADAVDLDRLVEEVKKKKLRKGIILKVPEQRYSAYVGWRR